MRAVEVIFQPMDEEETDTHAGHIHNLVRHLDNINVCSLALSAAPSAALLLLEHLNGYTSHTNTRTQAPESTCIRARTYQHRHKCAPGVPAYIIYKH